MISGWTASSRDSSKTEKDKAHRFRTNSLRTPDEFEAQLSRILPLKGQNPPGALCLSLPESYRLSGKRPSGYHSLLLRRKMSIVSPSPGRLSPGRKTPPSVSAPSPGLRLLIVLRFKCGREPCRGHSVLPCAGNTIWLQYSFTKELLKDSTSACRERVVAATGSSPFKVRDNQWPERTMSGVSKTFA